MELFESVEIVGQPLAARLRPRVLAEYIGQEHILGEGRLLRRLIQADRISSLIFYGPPGTGKTTLASVIANTTESRFVILNAVLSGVKQLREALEEAATQQKLYGKRTILFIDEVHRWNKSQQDALLPWVENGTVVLIGATTENPYFEVNPALVSRSRIFRLKKLDEKGMIAVVAQAIADTQRGYGSYKVTLEERALNHLVKTADGDARNLLNALELAVETTPDHFPPPPNTPIHITLQVAEDSIQQKAVLYDKEGDYHYDVISAFIKSVRGSDPDATLFWLARMIQAGEDPRYIFRRMLISACEDIGLANPNALGIVESAATAFDRVGLPEGRFMLSQAALYLATSQKSNSNLGFFDALNTIAKEESKEVPNHLKDPSRDGKSFGHGKGYLYPHAFKGHWTAQQYLPQGLQGRIFYHPTNQGYEAQIREEVLRKRELQLEQAIVHEDEENFSWSPENQKQSEWVKRAEQQSRAFTLVRDQIINMANIHRNDNLLILEENSALLYWEALRQAPEGGVYLLTDQKQIQDHIHHYFQENEILDIPMLIKGNRNNLTDLKVFTQKNRGLMFDTILARNLFSATKEPADLLHQLLPLLNPNGKILFSQKDFFASTSLSELLKKLNFSDNTLITQIREYEDKMVEDFSAYHWNIPHIKELFNGLKVTIKTIIPIKSEKKLKIDTRLLQQWFDPSKRGYGSLSQTTKETIEDFLRNKEVNWVTVENCFSLS